MCDSCVGSVHVCNHESSIPGWILKSYLITLEASSHAKDMLVARRCIFYLVESGSLWTKSTVPSSSWLPPTLIVSAGHFKENREVHHTKTKSVYLLRLTAVRPEGNKTSELLGVAPKTQEVLPRNEPVLRGQADPNEGTNALVG